MLHLVFFHVEPSAMGPGLLGSSSGRVPPCASRRWSRRSGRGSPVGKRRRELEALGAGVRGGGQWRERDQGPRAAARRERRRDQGSGHLGLSGLALGRLRGDRD